MGRFKMRKKPVEGEKKKIRKSQINYEGRKLSERLKSDLNENYVYTVYCIWAKFKSTVRDGIQRLKP